MFFFEPYQIWHLVVIAIIFIRAIFIIQDIISDKDIHVIFIAFSPFTF